MDSSVELSYDWGHSPSITGPITSSGRFGERLACPNANKLRGEPRGEEKMRMIGLSVALTAALMSAAQLCSQGQQSVYASLDWQYGEEAYDYYDGTGWHTVAVGWSAAENAVPALGGSGGYYDGGGIWHQFLTWYIQILMPIDAISSVPDAPCATLHIRGKLGSWASTASCFAVYSLPTDLAQPLWYLGLYAGSINLDLPSDGWGCVDVTDCLRQAKGFGAPFLGFVVGSLPYYDDGSHVHASESGEGPYMEVVPEPSTVLALLCGLGGLAWRRKD